MKKPFIIFTLLSVILSVIIFAGNAQADSKRAEAKEFFSLIENYRSSCNENCQAPFASKTAFDDRHPEKSFLAAAVKSHLDLVASFQAQIWEDTILEGDYYTSGPLQLENVQILLQNEILIGYKITYSEHAWYIGDCDFDSNDESSLKECNEGRIRESTFVSPDFKTFFSENFANFAS